MVSDSKRKSLEERMKKMGLLESDLEEHFIRSSGHGGQNVNKVNSCVYLKHIPTGLEVKCQKSRSQGDNRYFARLILCEKRENQILGAASQKAREIFKKKKQKQKRSKRAKEKMIEKKRERSKRIENRKIPQWD